MTTTNKTGEVAPVARAEATIQDLVRNNWEAISGALPETISSKRFAHLVFNSVRKTPRLAEATAASLVGSLLAAASLGLEVDTPLQEANLVPYRRKDRRTGREWTEAQLIIGYQGVLKLFRQHPEAGRAASGWVGERDEFNFNYGTDPSLTHAPASGDRGKPVAFWASYSLKDGTTDFVVLTPLEVAQLRGKGVDEKRDVADPQHWMERKTALKQVLKMAPRSTQLATAMVVDEQPIQRVTQMQDMAPVAQAIAHIDPAQEEPEPDDVDTITGEVAQPQQRQG